MYCVPFDITKLKWRVRAKHSRLFELLYGFNESGLACVQLKDLEYASLKSCQNSILTAIKRYKFTNIRCCISNGDVYLINESVQ